MADQKLEDKRKNNISNCCPFLTISKHVDDAALFVH